MQAATRRDGLISWEIIASGAAKPRGQARVAKGQNTAVKFGWGYAAKTFKIGTLRNNADEIARFKHAAGRDRAALRI